ncbi:SPT8-like protein [Thermothelomyces thermophilus ATCC 42464]|uniref:SPT8-like protein n=1 Tax=Thermothelomyces thermophilus (strain ATCC 42464 / BCRC 31852 / DSM 1799) TaxID=573729 RepID=G2Q4P6_THET4|nr:SPT8-like protein [Thermothelomyces thermophilus ATCC 42464]AEO54535.1 SPT8-like protein [Thermothelomyces thermophilus ATCC 42464]
MDDDYASSENEQDELMEDAEDLEAENDAEEENEDEEEDPDDQDEPEPEQEVEPEADVGEAEAEAEAEAEGESESIDASQALGADGQATSRDAPAGASAAPTSPAIASQWRPVLRQEYIDAPLYDIVPTMAAPQATSINALAITPDLRYWLTGGSDGYIRKYDGVNTINGKQQLTVAQRHPFVDSVVKAGVLMSYWENEEPAPPNARPEDRVLSPVYSLAVHSRALWLLSGLESGGINLQSVRHDEGKRIHCLREGGHTNAVSVLQLAPDEKSVLSGSWDKTVIDWDLNTGNVIRKFEGSGGQISAIELRPANGAPVPAEASQVEVKSETFFSETKPRANGFFQDGAADGANSGANGTGTVGDGPGSPEHESLFGSPAGSLFGDNDTMGGGGGGAFGDDDDEFSRAMDMGLHDDSNTQPLDNSADFTMGDADMPTGSGLDTGGQSTTDAPPPAQEGPSPPSSHPNGDGPSTPSMVFSSTAPPPQSDPTQTSANTFLAAAIDGTIRIWDRRVPNPVARISNRRGVPPWCMGACWSPDGNWIYAGRRNGTVEEFSIHNATSSWLPERTLKFPAGSGAVSCVRPMPNGRHLVCASHDILRLYDLRDTSAFKHSKVPFIIIPGPPKAGVISQLYIDPTSRIMISLGGTRGWDGTSTEVMIGYEIAVAK